MYVNAFLFHLADKTEKKTAVNDELHKSQGGISSPSENSSLSEV